MSEGMREWRFIFDGRHGRRVTQFAFRGNNLPAESGRAGSPAMLPIDQAGQNGTPNCPVGRIEVGNASAVMCDA